MADKPRKTGRPAGPKAGFERGARPGDRPRPAAGRKAGKPERGPAGPRKVGGVDLNALERLEQEGLLTEEGRRLRREVGGGDRGPRPARGGFASVDEQLAQSLGRGPRPYGRRPRADGGQEAGIRRFADRGFAERPDRAEGERPNRPAARGPGKPAARGPEKTAVRGPEKTAVRGPEKPVVRGPGKPVVRGPGKPVVRGPGKPVARVPAKAVEHGARKLNPAEAEVAERLHKVMARAGVASRRHSEELIQAGRVTVNGRVVTELGTKVVAGQDLIEVDGRPLGRPENLVYLLLNKPKGYVTTLYDPQGRPKVTDLLGGEIGARVYPVGRLDYETEGLLLLTNDGELANALMHPAKQVKKTYIAKVRGVPGPAKLRALEEGIELEDGPTAPADVKMIEVKAPNAATISIRIHEGRNRQVRRMFEAIGHEVIHLKRTTLGPLHLKDLAVGQWRELTEQEVRDLYSAAGLRPSPKKPAPARRGR